MTVIGTKTSKHDLSEVSRASQASRSGTLADVNRIGRRDFRLSDLPNAKLEQPRTGRRSERTDRLRYRVRTFWEPLSMIRALTIGTVAAVAILSGGLAWAQSAGGGAGGSAGSGTSGQGTGGMNATGGTNGSGAGSQPGTTNDKTGTKLPAGTSPGNGSSSTGSGGSEPPAK